MPRPLLLLAVTAVLALPASAAAAAQTTISAVATQTTSKTSGKRLAFTETLRAGGTVIGHDRVTCVSGSSNAATCKAVFTLTRGTIRVAGKVSYSAPSSTLRITGGTGVYTGKTGTLRLTPAGTRSLEQFTIR